VIKNIKLGFLGGGNMSQAILKGLLSASVINPKEIIVSDVDSKKLNSLKKDFKINTTLKNRETVTKSDVIIISVKPQNVDEVLQDTSDLAHGKKLFISVAAGVPIAKITNILSGKQPKKLAVARTMPNTPALVLQGVTAISFSDHVKKSDKQIVHQIFEAVGKTVEVDEDKLDAVTGLSGSGPAYIFTIMEALSDAGVKMGLSRDVANKLTFQTVLGAAQLASETGKHPGQLKDMVTSPGGTTIHGIHALEAGGIRDALFSAVEAATNRSKELGSK
jgi:pyrroline-5-carboxylate reductase